MTDREAKTLWLATDREGWRCSDHCRHARRTVIYAQGRTHRYRVCEAATPWACPAVERAEVAA